jgi:hypothetical protein
VCGGDSGWGINWDSEVNKRGGKRVGQSYLKLGE